MQYEELRAEIRECMQSDCVMVESRDKTAFVVMKKDRSELVCYFQTDEAGHGQAAGELGYEWLAWNHTSDEHTREQLRLSLDDY